MEIEGRIVKVSRSESTKEGVPAIHVTANVEMKHEGAARVADFSIYGYEPDVTFELGQKVTVVVAIAGQGAA